MLCTILVAIGLGSGCVETPPPRDQAAEVLIEQDNRQQAEVQAALAKRDRLYRRLGEKCDDCGKLDTRPFGRKE